MIRGGATKLEEIKHKHACGFYNPRGQDDVAWLIAEVERQAKALRPRDYATECAQCGEPAVTARWRGNVRYCAAHRPDGCPDEVSP